MVSYIFSCDNVFISLAGGASPGATALPPGTSESTDSEDSDVGRLQGKCHPCVTLIVNII